VDALKGIALILRTPRLWPLCAAPVLLASALYVLLGWIGWHFYANGIEDWSKAIVFLGYLVLFPFVFYLLASGFLGLVFDPLSRAVETQLGETVPTVPTKPTTLFADTLKRLLFNGSLGLLAFGLGFFGLGPVPSVLAAALIGLLDYTSPAYLRRGFLLGPQAKHLLPKPDVHTLSFALIAGSLSLLPFIGLLLAPGLVVGGTLLARRRLS
jgi:uncharacterized protein involved in cysteine biosynthesis